ncbi:MAG TPA: HEAT repeat domain-containing protein [Kofleriaceae bacterium]|nr:HEAT repeat domain-containing protein [Kofleriaceae bacterium]
MWRFRVAVACALAALPVTGLITGASVRAQPADWGVKRDPFNLTDIARYKAILRASPHDAGALAKLLELYRRYRTIDLLKDEYQKQLDKAAGDVPALIVLGRLQHATGDDARALDLFQRAVAHDDTSASTNASADAPTWILIGELQKAAGKTKDARAAYDKALAHASARDMKKKALRALADLALATGDNDGANAYFQQFLELDPKNAQLWIERGDAMLAAGKRELALDSYTAAEKLLGADPAKRVEVVARRGQALEGMAKDDEAVVEYRRAIKLAPKGYYLEVELTGRIVDIYRRKQSLTALLAQYEKEWPEAARGHFEWDTLGKLYEETGAQDKAITALKRAVAKAPWELETQRRLIQLLENSGRDDEALAAYEAVVRAAPGEARFQLDLAERYWRRGQEKKGLDTLTRLEQRFPQDTGVLSAIADLYMRWGKEDLAIVEYERLAKLEPDDPVHLITLGEQYWTKNDKPRALATWKRLIAGGKASGFAKLGEVMAEHGQASEARANFDKAIALDAKSVEIYKARAAFLETQKQYGDALADWEKVLGLIGTKPVDRIARRDARRHYVAVVTKVGGGREASRRGEWEAKARAGDVEAGYLLVEYFAKRPQKDQPQAALEDLHRKVPDDQDLTLDLVKLYKDQRKFQLAVDTLQELLKIAPAREREIYSMISGIKTEERKDGEAEEWIKKAVAKSPNDPAVYEHLAENYVAMQRFPDAITAYEKVIALDAHNTKAQFALAQLYVQGGEPMKAAELLRKVVRTANDEETVGHAARQAIDLEEMTDTLGELEKVLSPLSFMMAHKPIYRRVLVELYLRYVPRLVERETHGSDEVKQAARAELVRIGGHGLQPLLEALRDEKEVSQQRVAVAVLGHLGNKGAAEPLVHMARVEPAKDRRVGTFQENTDRDVRVDALVAAGRLGDPAVLGDVLPLMTNGEAAMREAATFTLGRSGDKRAVAPLLKALDDNRPSVQALACLGLAQIDDPRAGAALIKQLADARRHDAVRAACAYAIGARKIAAGEPALLDALADNRGEAQRLSAWALGQLGDPRALGPLIRAYFARAGHSDDELVWAIGRTSAPGAPGGVPASALSGFGEFPLRAGKYNLDEAVARLPGALAKPAGGPRLVVEHADDIASGLGDALGEHRDVIVAALSDLDGGTAQISLGALAPATAGTGTGTGTGDAKLDAKLATIAVAIEPKVAAQLASEDPKVRALAVSVLAKLDGGVVHSAEAAIAKALGDPADQVRGAAMSSVAVLAIRRGSAPPALVAALVKTLTSPGAAPWGDRRTAALALGRLGEQGDPAALIRAAGDTSSFVREAVATALAAAPGAPGGLDASLALSHDDVPQVRAAAARSLGLLKDSRAQQRRGELATDPDATVRAAAAAATAAPAPR